MRGLTPTRRLAPELTAPPVDIQPVGDPAMGLVSPAGSTSAPAVAFSILTHPSVPGATPTT
jgi:hypothetical protein